MDRSIESRAPDKRLCHVILTHTCSSSSRHNIEAWFTTTHTRITRTKSDTPDDVRVVQSSHDRSLALDLLDAEHTLDRERGYVVRLLELFLDVDLLHCKLLAAVVCRSIALRSVSQSVSEAVSLLVGTKQSSMSTAATRHVHGTSHTGNTTAHYHLHTTAYHSTIQQDMAMPMCVHRHVGRTSEYAEPSTQCQTVHCRSQDLSATRAS